jgi:hypothetical protein
MRKVKKLWRRHTHTRELSLIRHLYSLFFIEAIWLELITTRANIFAEILRRDLLNLKAANSFLLFSKFRSDLFIRVSFFFKSLCISFILFLREFGCRLSAGHHRVCRRQLRKNKKKQKVSVAMIEWVRPCPWLLREFRAHKGASQDPYDYYLSFAPRGLHAGQK